MFVKIDKGSSCRGVLLKARECHPDAAVGASEEERVELQRRMAALAAARDVLGDAERRWEYDRKLGPDPADLRAAEEAV